MRALRWPAWRLRRDGNRDVGFFTQGVSMKEYFQIPVEFATEDDYIWKIF
jgi:hypothetical protein